MEQRVCYRVGAIVDLESFRAELVLPQGRKVPARMDEVSARGMTAKVARSTHLPLERGDRVQLEIRCPSRGISLRLDADVRNVLLQQEKLCYGLEFVHPEELAEALTPRLFRLFNRRRSPRLSMHGPQRAFTVASERGRHALGVLRDISVSGASISVPSAHNPSFQLGDRISVMGRLQASGTSTPAHETVQLFAWVRRIREAPGARLYGIEFDWDCVAIASHWHALDRFISHSRDALRYSSARRMAERRAAQRARPDNVDAIEVELVGMDQRAAPARLRDLSSTGIGVAVAALQDPEFQHDEAMTVRLRLPLAEIGIVARVRRGQLVDTEVRYGLEFDSERTPNFSETQQQILDFVTRRSHEPEDLPLISFTPHDRRATPASSDSDPCLQGPAVGTTEGAQGADYPS